MEKTKLSEYIQQLQGVLEVHGDLDCYYCKDDEGNGYQTVNYGPGAMYLHKDDKGSMVDLLTKESIEDDDETPKDIAEYEKVCCVN